MFRNLLFATLFAVSFGGAITTSSAPAMAAVDTYMAFEHDQPALFETDDFSFDIEQ
jgi:hypothetical protein